MRTKKTPLFIGLSLFSLGIAGTIVTKIAQMISYEERGAFYVLLILFVLFLSLCAYMLFYAFGQKFILFQTIFEHSNDAISIVDDEGKYIWQNRSHHALFGLELEELQNAQASFYINTKEVLLKEELDRIKEFSGIFKSTSKQGYKDVFISAFRVENDLGDTLCYVQMKREAKEYLRIIEKSQSERERILALAQKDPLTQLFNRNGFDEALQKRLQEGKNGCIIFADIDNFKTINDTYGHDKGDKVLQAVSKRIQGNLRGSDVIARFGGEEFVMWVEAELEKSADIAEKIRQSIADAPIESLNVTCSFGVSVVENHAFEEAIKRADEAMYRAKKSGKNRVCIYRNDEK